MMNVLTRLSVNRAVVTARRLAFVAGISLPLALAGASYGQPAPQGSQGAPPAASHLSHLKSPEEMVAAHAGRLRAVLQLRPDQEAALTAFLASMKPAAGGMGHEPEDRAAERALTAPERMERMLAHMDKVRAEMAEKLDALKTFYSQLSPAQQKAFDALNRGHGRGHHHGRMGGHAG